MTGSAARYATRQNRLGQGRAVVRHGVAVSAVLNEHPADAFVAPERRQHQRAPAIVLGLILGTIAFLAVAKNMIATYNEIGEGKKTWGDMGMHGGMGVLLLVFVVYLLTQAATVIF